MDHDRLLAPSPFPGDDGSATPATRQALADAAGSAEPSAYLRAVAALCADRVLVPVVATAIRLGTTAPAGPDSAGNGSRAGLLSDKEAEMSVVMLQAADGRRAMLAFTGLDALHTWRVDARPVPITLDRAAQTALAEGVAAVLVDVAGPAPLAIEGEVLEALAGGRRLVETGPNEFGWAMVVDNAPPPAPPA